MQAELTDALADIVKRTVNFMFPVEARLLERRDVESATTPYDVSGIVGVTGRQSCAVVLSFPRDVAAWFTAWMLGEDDIEGLSEQDVSDCVGELTNIVGGNLLPVLEGTPPPGDDDASRPPSSVALPSVVVGAHRVIWGSKDTPCELMIFEVEIGHFAAEIGFRAHSAKGE